MKKISIYLLILALTMGMLAGCGGQVNSSASAALSEEPAVETTVPTEEPEPEPVPEEPEPQEESAAEPSAVEKETTAALDEIIPPENPYSLPLCEETTTYTFFWTYPPFLAEQIEDLTDGYARQELEARTNVHIEFDAVSAAVAGEQFQLMVAADSYADIIQDVTNYYTAGMDRAVTDEIVLDLKDLIPQEMPVYNEMIMANDTIRKQLTSSDGYIGAIYRLYAEPSVPKTGNVIRQDWLDTLNLEMPRTVEDYYNALTAFHSEMGASEPYYIMNTGVAFNNGVIGAFGVMDGFYQQDGKVKFGCLEQGFRDYLREMNRWYQDGLISPDFLNNVSGYPDNGDVTDGRVGIFAQENNYMQDVYSFTTDTSIVLSAVPNAVLAEGDTNDFITFGDWIGGVSWSISADCENPELLLNFVDYLFTDEGSLLANYGVEGLSWDYDENNEPLINEAITDNPDYNSSTAQLKYTLLWAPFVEDYDRFNVGYTQATIDAADIWMEQSSNQALIPSGVSISTDYVTTYNTIYSDVDTYAAENVNRFITGDRPIEEFDAFVAELKDMGVETCIEIWQEMLDAYEAK